MAGIYVLAPSKFVLDAIKALCVCAAWPCAAKQFFSGRCAAWRQQKGLERSTHLLQCHLITHLVVVRLPKQIA
jgi:hypothetical protein